MALMILYVDNFRAVFWWAVIPAAIAVAVLIVGVPEPAGMKPSERRGWPVRRADLARMSGSYWRVVTIGIVFTLAGSAVRFSSLKVDKPACRSRSYPPYSSS